MSCACFKRRHSSYSSYLFRASDIAALETILPSLDYRTKVVKSKLPEFILKIAAVYEIFRVLVEGFKFADQIIINSARFTLPRSKKKVQSDSVQSAGSRVPQKLNFELFFFGGEPLLFPALRSMRRESFPLPEHWP